MIKSLKKYQLQLTPFEATKNWELNNIDNDNLLLYESTGSDDGLPIALEFLDYGDGSSNPEENYSCDIALEQQGHDFVTLNEGQKVTGPFYPDNDPQNLDGTYKRPLYHQIKTMFYNTYLDPTKMWGNEKIEMSQTQKRLSDKFRLFDISKKIYGDKISPKSIIMYDNTLDDYYEVRDDGNGNLYAGKNIFSHFQEIGEWKNSFSEGNSSYCNYYWNQTIVVKSTDILSSSTTTQYSFLYGSLINQDPPSENVGVMYAVSGGLLFDTVISASMSIDSVSTAYSTTGGLLFDTVISSNVYESMSYVSYSFSGGVLFDTVVTGSVYEGDSYISYSFYTGSLDLVVITSSFSDAAKTSFGFYTGSIN